MTYVDPVGPERGTIVNVVYRGYHSGNSVGSTVWGISISGRTSMGRKYNNGGWENEGVRLCVPLR